MMTMTITAITCFSIVVPAVAVAVVAAVAAAVAATTMIMQW